MENRTEQLLKAWLRLSIGINNERLVSGMPYNESLICSILYCNMMEHPGTELTATDLCSKTRMLKSQMNRTLNCMEKKNIIVKERSAKDKRKIFIRLDLAQIEIYQEQHRKILDIVSSIIDEIGIDTADEAIRICNLVADTAAEVIK
ncbi:MAG: helix-turn-helix domain-containing protein [Lachnospiraceae bacterium]|nr:helix-turn-helix domain-containing protein [Lachnospiraceae bacterium]